MPIKTVSSEEARNRLRDVMDDVSNGEAEVIIERHGKPTVAVISYKEYERIRRDRQKRRAQLLKIRDEMEAGNYVTFEEAEAELQAKGLL